MSASSPTPNCPGKEVFRLMAKTRSASVVIPLGSMGRGITSDVAMEPCEFGIRLSLLPHLLRGREGCVSGSVLLKRAKAMIERKYKGSWLADENQARWLLAVHQEHRLIPPSWQGYTLAFAHNVISTPDGASSVFAFHYQNGRWLGHHRITNCPYWFREDALVIATLVLPKTHDRIQITAPA